MDKIKSSGFFNHSKNYLLAEFFNKGIVFLTIPIFTYLLSPEDYGVISIYAVTINIFIVLIGLNFHTSVARRYHEDTNDFSEFMGSNIIFLSIFNLCMILFLYFLKDSLASFFAIDNNVFFIAIIVSSLSVFLQVELSYLQTSQQSKKYVTILVIRNILLTLGAIVWIYLLEDNKYLGKIYSELLIMSIIFIFVIRDLIKISKFNFDTKFIKYALAYGIPLIPHTLSGLILLQADRIIINQISGSHETGLYSFAFNVGMIMSIFVTSFNNAWIPIFYKNLKEKAYSQIQSSANKYVKIIFIVTLVLILFSKEIVMIMADEKYYDALKIVPIIILGFTFVYLYTLYANYAFYRKKTGLISLFTFIAASVNIGLNYFFIPKYGYVSAAWTTLFSYFILFILHYINVKFILKENLIKLSSILIQLIILLLFIFTYFNINSESYIVEFGFKMLLISLMSILFFRIEMKNIFNNGQKS
ncbi:MAG: hypothetical protein COA92_02570 [Sulfurovum sp.]|nr:MAG: hypothetical protein COA92_02570 [Sulfurovum sp.]